MAEPIIDDTLPNYHLNKGETSTNYTTTKQPFISNDKFELLKNYQRHIFEVTEFTPNIRKLVNELITIENLEKVKVAFLKSLTS